MTANDYLITSLGISMPSDVVDALISVYIATFLTLKKKLTVSSECLKVINVITV